MFTTVLNKIKQIPKKFDIQNWFLIGVFFLAILVLMFSVMHLDKIVSLLHGLLYLAIFAGFALIVLSMILKRTKPDVLFWILISVCVIAFISIVFGFIFNDYGVTKPSLSYIRRYLMLLGTLIIFYMIYKTNVSENTVKLFIITSLLVCVFLGICYIFYYVEMYQFRGAFSGYLTFAMDNPNKTAIMLLLLCFFAVLGIAVFKDKFMKAVCAVAVVLLVFFMIETLSRNVLLIMIGFAACALWLILLKKKKFHNVFWLLVVLMPMLFFILYMFLINNPKVLELLSFMDKDAIGKGLGSRVEVWNLALDLFKQSPLYGSYFDFWMAFTGNINGSETLEKISHFYTMHSIFADVLTVYGVLTVCGVMVFMYDLFRRFNSVCSTKVQQLALLAFGCAYMTGFAEGALFAGSSGLFALFACLLAASKGCKDIKLWNEYDKKK